MLYVIPHSHFDLIWRRPFDWYRRRRVEIIDAALALLSAREDFRYTFSQAYLLETYLEDRPDKASDLRALVEAGRLEFIGGPMTIPDLNLSSGEAIVRNQLMGMRRLKKRLGADVTEALFEDAFGVPATLPQLLLRCGHTVYRSSRMPRLGREDLTGIYRWTGVDGSTIRCCGPHGMSWGFGHSINIADPPHTYPQRVEQYKQDLEKTLKRPCRSFRSHALLGEEHLPDDEAIDAFLEAIAALDIPFRWATVRDYCRALEEADAWADAPEYDDDFSRIFTGCYSTRISEKPAAARLESMLLARENLAALDHADAELDDTWRDLFLVQFHDAIGGCHTPENVPLIKQLCSKGITRLSVDTKTNLIVNPLPAARTLPFNWKGAIEPGAHASHLVQPLDDHWVSAQPLDAFEGVARVAQPAIVSPSHDTVLTDKEHTLQLAIEHGKEKLSYRDRVFTLPGLLSLREDKGSLWTEKYSGASWREPAGHAQCMRVEDGPLFKRALWRGSLSGREVAWKGFESLSWKRTLLVFKQFAAIWLRFEFDWKGNATEIGWRFETAEKTDGTPRAWGSLPFGHMERPAYSPGSDGLSGDVFASPRWSAWQYAGTTWYILNRGYPAFRLTDSGIENVLLRSPVSHAFPHVPVEPDPTAWENGHHEADFLLIPDDSFSGARAECYAQQWNITPISAEPPEVDDNFKRVLESVPAQLVVTSLSSIANGQRLRIHEGDGRACSWKAPEGISLQKVDFQGQALSEPGVRVSFKPLEVCDVLIQSPRQP